MGAHAGPPNVSVRRLRGDGLGARVRRLRRQVLLAALVGGFLGLAVSWAVVAPWRLLAPP